MFIELRDGAKRLLQRLPGGQTLEVHIKRALYRTEVAWYYPTDKVKTPGSLREFHIEFNSACNLRCRYCALDHEKPRQWMKPDLLDAALQELTTNPLFKGLEQINLFNGGETLLHPKRLEMFEVIARHKHNARAAGRPFPRVLLLTNGMLLRPALTDAILATGAVDTFQFSMDGGTPAAFEELRHLAKWPVFSANLRYLHTAIQAMNPRPNMQSITIIPQPHPLNASWMDPDFKSVLKLMNRTEFRRLHDWGGQVDVGGTTPAPVPKSCTLMLHQMVLLPDGKVTVCCSDLNAGGVLGTFQEQSLAAIYASEQRLRYIR